MHHHPQNQERALNLSILTVSGPVNVPAAANTQSRAPTVNRRRGRARQYTPCDGPTARAQNPTTSFLPQQLKYTLLELELPRLLAPDLPSNGYSLKVLECTHSNYRASLESCIVIFRHYLPASGMGNLARLLPSLEVVAVSQAPSPESNPDSPSPRKNLGRQIPYRRKLIGADT
ncbi:unnamed protein product [Clavelina lepadiformis]|uniref:Uncharacterized protein n=1 Tax=Clavelina lepadiformis TaxID=159417 RepID=A0ABP0FQ85_CLALP